MKVLIAIDSFKGSMTSIEAGNAAREGLAKVLADAKIIVKPLADGGEGTVTALVEGLGGHYQTQNVKGPLGAPVAARYGIISATQPSVSEPSVSEPSVSEPLVSEPSVSEKIAVIEMAEASGITLVKREELNPWKASTYGLGQLIKDAIQKGCRDFIIGIGGSATTEAGIGMLCALGYEFLDREGNILPGEFQSLSKVQSINFSNVIPELKECHFQIACDVTNPLCGENGSIYVYGPQKGVKLQQREEMDSIMQSYARKIAEITGHDYSTVPGAGAAGGLGFAFRTFMQSVELKPGIDIVLSAINLEEELSDTDLVITGEGQLDGQTANGKVPVGVARMAKIYGCRVIAFAGSLTEDAAACNEAGIDAFFSIVPGCCSLEEAMKPSTAIGNMSKTVEQWARSII